MEQLKSYMLNYYLYRHFLNMKFNAHLQVQNIQNKMFCKISNKSQYCGIVKICQDHFLSAVNFSKDCGYVI